MAGEEPVHKMNHEARRDFCELCGEVVDLDEGAAVFTAYHFRAVCFPCGLSEAPQLVGLLDRSFVDSRGDYFIKKDDGLLYRAEDLSADDPALESVCYFP